MVRTVHKFKKNKSQDSPKKQPDITLPLNPPVKARGKTYQNKSSLDNWDQQKAPQNIK